MVETGNPAEERLVERLEAAISGAARRQVQVGLLVIQTADASSGESALANRFHRVVEDGVRASDLVVRVAPDEHLVLLVRIRGEPELLVVARRLLSQFDRAGGAAAGGELPVRIGAVLSDAVPGEARALLARAVAAAGQAGGAGERRVQLS